MPPAADLLDAAIKTANNLYPRWQNNTLQARVNAFWAAISPTFQDQTPNDQPVGNWIALIAALGQNILTYNNGGAALGQGTTTTFELSVDYVYRLCKFAYYYNIDGFISNAQATVILNAYNAQFP